MNVAHSAKLLLGRLLRPIHAGEEKLLALERHLTPAREMIVHSAGFELGGPIPPIYAGPGAGENVSPPLAWSGVPANTVDLLLVCEDPDAPALQPFIHWMVRIPPSLTCLPEGLAPATALGEFPGLVQGVNSADTIGYYGPLPPVGHGVHHYYFELFALDRAITLPEAADHRALVELMTGHVLAEGHHVGTFERR